METFEFTLLTVLQSKHFEKLDLISESFPTPMVDVEYASKPLRNYFSRIKQEACFILALM